MKDFSRFEVIAVLFLVVAAIGYYNSRKDQPTVTVTFEAVKETSKDSTAAATHATTESAFNKGNFKGGYIKGNGSPSQPKKWKR